MATILTTDDLDEYAGDMYLVDPQMMRADLVAAVDEDRIADPGDVAYALSLASSAAARLGDEDHALALAARAVEASRGQPDHDLARGEHAELLLRYGHEAEGMAALRALRPLLSRVVLADHFVLDPLTRNGRHELAEEWTTAALTTALEAADRAEVGSEQAEDAYEVADRLLIRRYDIRRELDLPLDDTDHLAEQVDDDGTDFRFWPEAAFAELIAAAEDDGEDLPTWDEHRAEIERGMQEADPADLPLIEVGTPALLAALLADDGTTPPSGPTIPWPPGRNDACWCGSRVKYKKCCLPRGRD